jgi:threonine dehydratase
VAVSGIAADSLGARRIGAIAWEVTQRHVRDALLLPDAAIRQAQLALWKECKLAVEPAAALPLAALRKLAARGAVGPDELVVAVVTSTGLKDPEATAARLPAIPLIEPTFAALQRVLDGA